MASTLGSDPNLSRFSSHLTLEDSKEKKAAKIEQSWNEERRIFELEGYLLPSALITLSCIERERETKKITGEPSKREVGIIERGGGRAQSRNKNKLDRVSLEGFLFEGNRLPFQGKRDEKER